MYMYLDTGDLNSITIAHKNWGVVYSDQLRDTMATV